jgi:hypothetical protein
MEKVCMMAAMRGNFDGTKRSLDKKILFIMIFLVPLYATTSKSQHMVYAAQFEDS